MNKGSLQFLPARPAHASWASSSVPQRLGYIAARASLLGLLILAACREDDKNPASVVAPSPIAERPATSTLPNPAKAAQRKAFGEDMLAELQENVSTAGGFFFSQDGAVNVWVTDLAQAQRAKVAIQALLMRRGIKGLRADSPPVRVLRGKFTFAQLEDWRDRLFDATMVPGIYVLDLDERLNRVRIDIAAGTNTQALQERFAALGVDTSAVIYEVTSGPNDTRATMAPTNITVTTDTIVGGLVAAMVDWHGPNVQWGCTTGVVGMRNSVPVAITASHCSSNQWYMDGWYMYNAMWGRKIGHEVADPYGWGCGINTCRGSDASAYQLESGINYHVGRIIKPASPNTGGLGGGRGTLDVNTSDPYFYVANVENGNLVVGQRVDKVGTTSGWTWGDLTNTCEHHNKDAWPTKRTVCVYRAGFVSEEGDSGGSVFAPYSGNYVTFAGIILGLMGDRAVFSKWSRVVNDLGGGLSLGVTQPAPPSAPSVTIFGTSEIEAGNFCSWSAGVTGATGTVTYEWTINGDLASETSSTISYQNTGSSFTLGVLIGADNGAVYAEKEVTVMPGMYCT